MFEINETRVRLADEIGILGTWINPIEILPRDDNFEPLGSKVRIVGK